MKKILLVAAIMVAVLALLALPKSQAGAGKGKPIRWEATVTGANLTGVAEFVGGVDHVNINNGVGTNDTPCSAIGTSGSYSFLQLQVFTPSLIFKDIGYFSSWGNPDLVSSSINLAPYGFPPNLTIWPDCVAAFLNFNVQPTADYAHIDLRFTTCGCGNVATDLMAMKDGDILPVHMILLFFSHIWGCPPSSPFTQNTFLNLNMSAHGYSKTLNSLPDIYIQRVGDVWTAYVDTVFDNPHYQNIPPDSTSANWPVTISDNILGQYATCASQAGKKGKTTWTTTYHYPWAKAPLKFQITFTKL